MDEMESVVTPEVGNIVAYCRSGKMGLILKKVKTEKGPKWQGRILEADAIDCEYRIMQIKNGKLSKKNWSSVDPNPIGFLPPDEVKVLIAGGLVNRGC